WEVDTGKERPPLKGHRKGVYAIAFAPDGKTLASAGWDETVRLWEVTTVRLWDVASGKELRRCKGRPDYFMRVAFTPDGKTLAATGGRGWIQLFDTRTGEPRRVSAEPPDGLRRVRFLPDSKRLISAGGETIASGDGVSVRLWEAATGKELRPLVIGTARVSGLALSPDGKVAAVGAWEGEGDNAQSKVSLYRVATGKELLRITVPFSPLAFTPDGKTLIAAPWKEGIRLYQASTGKEIRRLKSGRTRFDYLAVSPDGTMLAAGGEERWGGEGPSWDPTVWLWDLASGKELRRLRFPHRLPKTSLHALAFSPDSRLLATVSEGWSGRTWLCMVQLWDATTGKELRRLEEENDRLYTVVFSPDGRTLATGGKSLRLWEVVTGKERRQLRGHDGPITLVDFSPDGRLLVSSSQDRTALVWDLTAGTRGVPAAQLSDAQLQRYWDALAGDDAAKAYQAVRVLAATPGQAVALLRERLRPVPSADSVRLARLIRNLDSGRFSVREQAAKELEQLGDVALVALRKAAQGSPALETRRRLERLIERATGWTPERLQAWRALEVLEAIDTPEARTVLQALARGAAEARLTREARASLDRLVRQAAPNEQKRKD
ncbi:MAG: WD40 repeat domain-containing protein, partial [Planctomycetes bacterium]|nr:WD40 repeat domain-containing protein [Planctomycetota bacterium]